MTMRYSNIILILALFFSVSFDLAAQDLEVDGTAKVNQLATDNSATSVVVVLPDGTLGVRDAATLGSGGGGGSSMILVGGGSAFNGSYTDDNFIPLASSFRGSSYDLAASRVSLSGTLNLFAAAIPDATTETNYVFTVYKNGVATGLTCTVNQGSTSCSDLANCVEFTAGDTMAVLFKGNSGTGTSDNREGRFTAVFNVGATCP